MSDRDASTPRVFLARHGETEWTINGRYTGITELELTSRGEKQVLGTGRRLVGPGKLIDPVQLERVFVSPRKRARKTFELLFGADSELAALEKVEFTEDIAEWGYGAYEGLLGEEIIARRKEQGLDIERPWDIWNDGCEGGESSEQATERLDGLINRIRDIQRPYMHGEKPVDIVLVAHGHILRAFTKRWLGIPMGSPLGMMLPPGGIGVLSYEEHDISAPAFLVGIALPLEEG
ncbi:putative phosphoglycerate mutase [Trematosphaeria pertusa]|uniref:Putative phosphoglycerate mutase n=1 Tax=Trematosphaeria pertusa TaxID=390896 RepID=A0A6A6IP95_9PLEO|nr:putative phosphoglycerate mutase [Trematosphaeria pertusa]KAF2252069.1 putative phosphoglycerate mutase [Trematosphaeria pertusa]